MGTPSPRVARRHASCFRASAELFEQCVVEPWWDLHSLEDSQLAAGGCGILGALQRSRVERENVDRRTALRVIQKDDARGSSASPVPGAVELESETSSDEEAPLSAAAGKTATPTLTLTPHRHARLYQEVLSRLLMAVACVSPWVWLRGPSLSFLTPAAKMWLLWTLLLNCGFAYVAVAICHRGHLFRGAA
jgi:hypothetical protein